MGELMHHNSAKLSLTNVLLIRTTSPERANGVEKLCRLFWNKAGSPRRRLKTQRS
jgi:hypothetical protein